MANDAEQWAELEDQGFIRHVGPIEVLRGPEVSRFRFHAVPKHKNLRGVVQGGMLMTFADRSMGMTARKGDVSKLLATVQLDVHFLDAAMIDEVVEISCRVLRETNSLIFIDGILTVGDRTVATARGTWKKLRRKAQPGSAQKVREDGWA